jgi:hypothetical protein
MNLPWLSRTCASGPARTRVALRVCTARHPACDLHLAGGGTVDRTAGRTHRCACLCWRELDHSVAADVVGPLIGHAQYAPTAWVGRMHAEPPGVRTTGWLRYEAHRLRASAKPTRRKGIA